MKQIFFALICALVLFSSCKTHATSVLIPSEPANPVAADTSGNYEQPTAGRHY